MNSTTVGVVAQSVYSTKGLKNLSRQKEMYCFHLASGASPEVAGKAVGATEKELTEWQQDKDIKALLAGIEENQKRGMTFTREKLSLMLLESYYKAGTATEEIAAVREIGKLQGLYSPEIQEVTVNVNNVKQLETMTAEELAKLAGLDNPSVIEGDFKEVSNG